MHHTHQTGNYICICTRLYAHKTCSAVHSMQEAATEQGTSMCVTRAHAKIRRDCNFATNLASNQVFTGKETLI